MDEQQGVIGFLGGNGVLFCSRDCARAQGQSHGSEVDQDEYESLVEGGTVAAVTLCPGCGAEFAVEWLEREPG